MSEPLNPFLYARLRDAYGEVKIASPGIGMSGEWVTRNGRQEFAELDGFKP